MIGQAWDAQNYGEMNLRIHPRLNSLRLVRIFESMAAAEQERLRASRPFEDTLCRS
jgi:hypothetical protein